MSKSLGNFYTLRDLFQRGCKPSTIRFLLASVPYRRQLNFTFDGLQQAASSVERLRNFVTRLQTEKLRPGQSAAAEMRASQAEEEFQKGLEDDLNTAQALAAIFDLLRDVNTSIDRGEFRAGDRPAVLAAMQKFDAIFALLQDEDEEKLRQMGFQGARPEISDAQIEALIGERQEARRQRDFKRADQIRQKLAESGIILEDTRDAGVRWKRK